MQMLEKIFGAEIEAALSGHPHRALVQTKSKVIETLAAQGMVKKDELRLGGRFPVTVRGWVLTALGHMTYCMSCTDDPGGDRSEG